MCGLLWVGAWCMDTLQVAQMAAQEASGVMAAVMLWQQGAMEEMVGQVDKEELGL